MVLHADDSVYECRQGKTPVKITDANPRVPCLNDATFDVEDDVEEKDRYIDTKNNIAIVLQKKDGPSYHIKVATADKVK